MSTDALLELNSHKIFSTKKLNYGLKTSHKLEEKFQPKLTESNKCAMVFVTRQLQ